MVGKLVNRGKNILLSPQSSILSAALVIMLMIVVAQVFGVMRQWVVLRFLGQDGYSLYLASFRLPDLVFEVFSFGAFSSAFIPVFTKHLKTDQKFAWDIAARVINIALAIFIVFAIIFGVFSYQFYSLVTPGYSKEQVETVASLARILFAAQGLFIVSYVITGVLESLRRFFIPALAPIFYNIGIILGTVLLAKEFGLYAPTIGAVLGACAHLLVQLPLAYKLGFRFSLHFRPNEGVREIGKLAAPRLIELSFLQVLKTAELFFSSIISIAAYAYLNLASSLQGVPTMLFGVSLAKAALVSLAHQEDDEKFRHTFLSTLYQIMFFIVPVATVFMVLRIPIVRLIYGTSQSLDWEATVQTGLVLSAFALGVPFQAALALLSRAFYARHNTKTPVVLSIIDVALTITLELIFVLIFRLPVWSIALANTIAGMVQVSVLYVLLSNELNARRLFSLKPLGKILFAATTSGLVMYFLLKLFDRSVWVKRLSFLNSDDAQTALLHFQSFVLDTRYTGNLLVLTIIVALIGMGLYLIMTHLLGSQELTNLVTIVRKGKLVTPPKDGEVITSQEA
jgi:putative peptidoglycan lipid II flippase